MSSTNINNIIKIILFICTPLIHIHATVNRQFDKPACPIIRLRRFIQEVECRNINAIFSSLEPDSDEQMEFALSYKEKSRECCIECVSNLDRINKGHILHGSVLEIAYKTHSDDLGVSLTWAERDQLLGLLDEIYTYQREVNQLDYMDYILPIFEWDKVFKPDHFAVEEVEQVLNIAEPSAACGSRDVPKAPNRFAKRRARQAVDRLLNQQIARNLESVEAVNPLYYRESNTSWAICRLEMSPAFEGNIDYVLKAVERNFIEKVLLYYCYGPESLISTNPLFNNSDLRDSIISTMKGKNPDVYDIRNALITSVKGKNPHIVKLDIEFVTQLSKLTRLVHHYDKYMKGLKKAIDEMVEVSLYVAQTRPRGNQRNNNFFDTNLVGNTIEFSIKEEYKRLGRISGFMITMDDFRDPAYANYISLRVNSFMTIDKSPSLEKITIEGMEEFVNKFGYELKDEIIQMGNQYNPVLEMLSQYMDRKKFGNILERVVRGLASKTPRFESLSITNFCYKI